MLKQRRAAIARTIVAELTIVLADEPTSALDAANGRAILEISARIAAKPTRAVLVVSHNSRLTRFADRILYIEDGVLLEEDSAGSNIRQMRSSA